MRTPSPAARSRGADRWWIEGGEEECDHCGRHYAFEAEVRCVDCDAPMCPLCVAWIERRAHCAGCARPKGR